MLQATCPDTVGTFFVFLHLLKREAKGLSELPLAHSQHQSAHSHTVAHVFVDKIW